MLRTICLCMISLWLFAPHAASAGVQGGPAWKAVYPDYPPVSSYSIKDILGLSNGTFIALADPGSFRTIDGGLNWKYVDTGLEGTAIGAFFLNSGTGWMWSSREIAYTNDGGSSWNKLAELPWRDRPIAEGLFLNDKVGFVRSLYGDLLRTEDGGRNWTKVPTASLQQTLGRKMFFFSAASGIRISGSDIFRTVDAGATWQMFHHGETRVAAACFDGKSSLIIEEFGDTFLSTDGGKTWKESEIKPYDGLAAIHFTPDCNAIGVSPKGIVYLTTDRGRTWTQRDPRKQVQEALKGKFVNQAVLKVIPATQPGFKTFALLGYGYMLTTADGGRTWHERKAPGDIFLQPSREGRVFSLAEPNVIAYSDDLGASWRRLVTADETVIAVAVLEKGTGYAVTNNGTIVRSENQKGAWQIVSHLNVPDVRKWSQAHLSFADEKNGVLWINKRYIYSTADGGRTWKALLDLKESAVPELRAIDEYRWEQQLALLYEKTGTVVLRGMYGFLANLDTSSGKVTIARGNGKHPACAQFLKAEVWNSDRQGWAIYGEGANEQTLSLWHIDGGMACKKISSFPVKGSIRGLSSDGDVITAVLEAPDKVMKYHMSPDGGKTWSEVAPPRVQADIVHVSAGKNGMVVSLDNANRLWTSMDAGRTWTARDILPYRASQRPFLLSGSRWVSGVWMSVDKGATWRRGPKVCNSQTDFGSLQWDERVTPEQLAQRFGQCGKEMRSHGNLRAFVFPKRSIFVDEIGQTYHREDGSSDISKVGAIHGVSEKERPSPQLGSIAFVDEDHGCAFGMFGEKDRIIANGIFCTKDGGRSWKQARIEKADDDKLMQPEKENGRDRIQADLLAVFSGYKGAVTGALQLTDARNGWAVVTTFARKAYIVRTTDGGAHWKPVSELQFLYGEDARRFLGEMKFVGFADENRGYIGGSSFLYVTEDGGKTFRQGSIPQRFGSILQLMAERGKTYLVTEKAILEFVGAKSAANAPVQASTPTFGTTSGPGFTGLYVYGAGKANMYLRFYSDGAVVSITSPQQPEIVATWLNRASDVVGKGRYSLKGNSISFSTSNESGTVDYKGELVQEKLNLDIYSHINRTKHHLEYVFVAVPFEENGDRR